jgi:hypothetical protein
MTFTVEGICDKCGECGVCHSYGFESPNSKFLLCINCSNRWNKEAYAELDRFKILSPKYKKLPDREEFWKEWRIKVKTMFNEFLKKMIREEVQFT